MEILTLIIIALSLSMDAFSLSLVYGTLQIRKKYMLFLSTIVGICHFFMPLIGIYFGNKITKYIEPNLVSGIVFIFIGIEMIIDSFKNETDVKILSIVEMFLFGLAVSIDSFSLGIGLNLFTSKYILAASIFCLFSFLFTFIGLNIGKNISSKIGKISTIIGGLILSSIGIICLFH